VPRCPACGAPHAEDAERCPSCGAALHEEEPYLELAGVGRRVAALLLDTAAVFFPLDLLVTALGGNGISATTATNTAGHTVTRYHASGPRLLAVIGFDIVAAGLYSVLLKSSRTQATLGQLAAGLQVVDVRGNRIGIRQATVRYLVYLLTIVTLGVGGVAMLASRHRQTLQDLIARTLVVRKL
jgi:uncharacterized RDD family membrane protein YckC